MTDRWQQTEQDDGHLHVVPEDGALTMWAEHQAWMDGLGPCLLCGALPPGAVYVSDVIEEERANGEVTS